MIIKSSSRGNGQQLAAHLLRHDHNERVELRETRFLAPSNVRDAIGDMETLALGADTTKPLFHVMLNPEQPLSATEWLAAWATFEAEFHLENQPFVEVEHLKKGRVHRHRVYSRIDEIGRAIPDRFNRIRNEKVARILEHKFHHSLTVGAHNLKVMNQLRREGHGDIADWMQPAAQQPRPVATLTHAEQQQADRTGIDTKAVRKVIFDAWSSTSSGPDFAMFLINHKMTIAKGDKPNTFVVVDHVGGVHEIGRAIRAHIKANKISAQKVQAKDLRTRFTSLILPSIEQAADKIRLITLKTIAALPAKPPVPAPVPTPAPTAAPIKSGADGPTHSQRTRQRRVRIENARDQQPSILVADERIARNAKYKLHLLEEHYHADLPDFIAQNLHWVRARQREVVIQLHDGARLRDDGYRISTSITSLAAVQMMCAAARAHGWHEVVLNGPPEFQAMAAQALTRAGIAISDPSPEVQKIIEQTAKTIRSEPVTRSPLRPI